jgi:hypothetical protein
MPIQVTCPGCKATFSVGDKFAGKQGPCPKCKTVITIPKPQAEVKIHAPEGVAAAPGAPGVKIGSAGKGTTPRPIRRQETNLSKVWIGLIVAGAVGALAVAWFRGPYFRDPSDLPADASLFRLSVMLRLAAASILALPIVRMSYAILRDDELEAFAGRSLWVRCTICAFVYVVLWCVFFVLPADAKQSMYSYVILAPPFFLVGAGVAFVCFDLDFGSSLMHYSFYVLITLALGYLAGLPMPWTGVTL